MILQAVTVLTAPGDAYAEQWLARLEDELES